MYSGAHRIADYPIKRITHDFRTDDLSWCSAVTSNHAASEGAGVRFVLLCDTFVSFVA